MNIFLQIYAESGKQLPIPGFVNDEKGIGYKLHAVI